VINSDQKSSVVIDSCHQLTGMMTTGQQLVTSGDDLIASQLQQQQFTVSSDELLRSRQDVTLDTVMLPHKYMVDLCPVCNDRVSGYHYGLQTCESCKGNGIMSNITNDIHLLQLNSLSSTV